MVAQGVDLTTVVLEAVSILVAQEADLTMVAAITTVAETITEALEVETTMAVAVAIMVVERTTVAAEEADTGVNLFSYISIEL
jgi:hypothetical protein